MTNRITNILAWALVLAVFAWIGYTMIGLVEPEYSYVNDKPHIAHVEPYYELKEQIKAELIKRGEFR